MAIQAAPFKVRAAVSMRQVALSCPGFLAIVLNEQGDIDGKIETPTIKKRP